MTLTNVEPNDAGPRRPSTGQTSKDADDTDEQCLPGVSHSGNLALALGVGTQTDTCTINTTSE